MALFSTLSAVTVAVFAATAGDVPGLIEEREVRLPVCPISVDLKPDGRLKDVRFVFVPVGYRSGCQGKTLRECRDLARERRIPIHAERRAEPDLVLHFKAGANKRELINQLSVTRAVKDLRGRKDVTWVAAGTAQEYPIDKKRVVKARLKWRVFANREELELLGLVK